MIPITILISLYNAAHDWPACWESIRAQTFVHWECVVVDDGSTDETAMQLVAHAAQDQRLRVITNERNIGLTASLNRGLKEAQGEYVARLNVEDKPAPVRLERQYAYFHENPTLGILGSAYEENRPLGLQTVIMPLTHTGIVWQLSFQNALMHAAVMAKREVMLEAGGYDERLRYAQDYDLWERLIGKTRFANLPEILLNYAVHPDGVSQKKQAEHQGIAEGVSQRRLKTLLGEDIPMQTVQQLRTWYSQMPVSLSRDILSRMGLYFRILDRLKEDSSLDRAELGRIRGEWHARIARLMPDWSDVRAAGWGWQDVMGTGTRLIGQRVLGE
jgi:hypothetical protein